MIWGGTGLRPVVSGVAPETVGEWDATLVEQPAVRVGRQSRKKFGGTPN